MPGRVVVPCKWDEVFIGEKWIEVTDKEGKEHYYSKMGVLLPNWIYKIIKFFES